MTVVDFPQQGTIGATLKPKRYDVEMYQGDTFRFALKFLDGATPTPGVVDITGWTVLAQIRTVTGGTVGGTIEGAFTSTVDGPNGLVYLEFDSSSLDPGEYGYDVQMTDGSAQRRTYIGGKVTITRDISE